MALNHRLIPAWDFALLAHRSSWLSSPGLGWQAIVTLIGLTVIRGNRWYANIPGLIIGNIIFIVFLLLIRDYVAMII